MQLVLEVEQFLCLAGLHLADGDARPAAHDVGDVVGSHLVAKQLAADGRALGNLLLELWKFGVSNLGNAGIVAITFCLFGLAAELLHAVLQGLHLVGLTLLILPLLSHLLLLLAQVGNLFLDVGELGSPLPVSPLRLCLYLAADGFALYLELREPTGDFVQFLGHGVALHAEFGGCLVHEVDGLIGQEALGDIALRELHGGNDGVVLDAHFVVILVAFLQSAQDADAGEGVRLVDHDGLESSLQGLVLLEVLLVFVERRSADAAHLAACQCGLQDVGSVHRAFALACSDQGVNLVDKEDDASVALRHLLDHVLQSFLELALVHGAGYEGTHVEAVELFVLQVLGHVAAQDAVGQSLHDGCLARAGFADEDRIVLRASREDLQHTAYLVVAADDGVELSGPCLVHEVAGILLQALLLGLLILVVLYHSILSFRLLRICFTCVLQRACKSPAHGFRGIIQRREADKMAQNRT